MNLLEAACALSIVVLSSGDPKVDYRGPGWYRVELENGQEMTLKVLSRKNGTYSCRYQGISLEVAPDKVRSLRHVSERAEGEGGSSLDAKSEEKIRDAAESLASGEFSERRIGYDLLAKHFPDCRAVLHESLKHRSKSVRKLSAKLLGEKGDSEKDLEPLLPLLRDSEQLVRLAAVMSLRKLGPGALDEVLRYIPWEPVANNRKMAVKNLERWLDPRAAEPLVDLIEWEKDRGVRVFMARALKRLTGRDLGEEPAAWRAYVEELKMKEDLERARPLQKGEVTDG